MGGFLPSWTKPFINSDKLSVRISCALSLADACWWLMAADGGQAVERVSLGAHCVHGPCARREVGDVSGNDPRGQRPRQAAQRACPRVSVFCHAIDLTLSFVQALGLSAKELKARTGSRRARML